MPDSTAPDLQQRLSTALAGQYRIDRMLGQGGMGSVFLAQDESLDRPVAIKVIAPEVAGSADVRERFILESRTVARLRHPNIVAVYAAGETAGLLWFAMEFVPGESLRDRMTREGRLDETTATAILHDIGMALDHAHGQGLVHRDVKPENVLLDRDSGRAMLTDFGVARGLAGNAQLTGAGFVLGSPRYMSPEQASGETIDQRSDLYSLGLVAYEVLTGGPAVEATSVAAILAKHLTERVPPVQQAAGGVSASVAGAVNKLLEKDPADRFQRGAAFAAALLGEPFDEATPTPVARARAMRGSGAAPASTAPKSRKTLAIVGAVLLAAAAGVAALVLRPSKANEKEWLVSPFEVQGPDRSLDWLREGSLNMLTLSLAQWQDLHVVDYEHTLDLLRDAKLEGAPRVGLEQARTVARKAGAGRVVTGQVTEIGDSLIVTASLYDAVRGNSAIDKARAAGRKGTDPRVLFSDIASQLLDLQGAPRLSVDLVQQTTSSIEAYRRYLSGLRALNSWRLAAADSLFDQAIALDTTFALAYYRKSVALGWNGAYDSTRLEWADKAQRYVGRLPARVQELVKGHVDQTRAFVAMARRDTAAARVGFLASRERLAKLVASDSTDAEAWFALADADYHVVFNTSYGYSPDSTVKYLNESLRGFRRTIQLDSTFHLAFSHLVDMYNKAGIARSFLVIKNDSIVAGGPSEYEARLGSAAEVEALRAAASVKAREAARGWIASDPDALQARVALATNFAAAREVDSAVAVLSDARTRPATSDPYLPWAILDVKARNWRAEAAPVYSTLLSSLTIDSLRAMRPGQGTFAMISAITAGGALGRPSLVTSAVDLYAKLDTSRLPGWSVSNAELMRYYAYATRAAMQAPLTAADRAQIDALTRRVAQLPIGARDPSIPYLLYLATGDAAFRREIAAIMTAREDSIGYPELDALEAITKGDSTLALRVAKTIPSADSIRRSRIGSSGMRVVARAMLLERLGDTRRAVMLLEAIDPVRFPLTESIDHTLAIYARQFAYRGRLYEKLGERDKAIAAYERFATMWANAEESLQPEVRAARDAVARLRDQRSATPVKGASGGAP